MKIRLKITPFWGLVILTKLWRLPNIESSRKRRLRIIRKLIVDCKNWCFQFVLEVIQNNRKNKSGTAGFASRAIVFTITFFFGIVMTGI